MTDDAARKRIVIVTGLSGAGKASVLRALEDLGYDAVDNPPLGLLTEVVARADGNLAIGVDARTRGFDAGQVVAALDTLRADPALRPELIYTVASDTVLLRRYTESRRRHPLAPQGLVADGIAAERTVTASLRVAADLTIDTSDLSLGGLRQTIDRHFGAESAGTGRGLVVSLVSFGFPRGLPPEAELVFDARFLRNPHYDTHLRPLTGRDPGVGDYIEADPDFDLFFQRMAELVEMVLPRFVQEGKKYTTVAVGCTGGRHRSVYLIEKLAKRLASHEPAAGWRLHIAHRELDKAPEGRPDGHDVQIGEKTPPPGADRGSEGLV